MSGEYSKPAPDPGDENGASEPRVRRTISHSGFTSLTYCRYSQHMWDLLSEICDNMVSLLLVLTVVKSDCSCLFAGGPNRHSTTNVQSTCWAGPPRVLYQSTTGCSGVFIALHKHGGGKASPSLCFSSGYPAFSSHYFFSHTEELSLWVQPV